MKAQQIMILRIYINMLAVMYKLLISLNFFLIMQIIQIIINKN